MFVSTLTYFSKSSMLMFQVNLPRERRSFRLVDL